MFILRRYHWTELYQKVIETTVASSNYQIGLCGRHFLIEFQVTISYGEFLKETNGTNRNKIILIEDERIAVLPNGIDHFR